MASNIRQFPNKRAASSQPSGAPVTEFKPLPAATSRYQSVRGFVNGYGDIEVFMKTGHIKLDNPKMNEFKIVQVFVPDPLGDPRGLVFLLEKI